MLGKIWNVHDRVIVRNTSLAGTVTSVDGNKIVVTLDMNGAEITVRSKALKREYNG
jgi:preprotein translocase subunit YajC